MKTIGDYYSVIQQAEKVREDIYKMTQNYRTIGSTESSEYVTLVRASAYIKSYIEMVKQIEVEE